MMEETPGLNLNSIVYATDFSLCSQNAGLYASRLARYFSSRLLVTHAFIPTQPAMEVEIDSSLVSQQSKDLLFMLTRKAFILVSQTAEAVPVLLEGFPKKVLPEPAGALTMISAFLATSAFMMTFYSLEVLGRQSKAIAWWASASWLPLLAFTVVGALVHMSAYIVIPLIFVYGVWAFCRKRVVR